MQAKYIYLYTKTVDNLVINILVVLSTSCFSLDVT